MAIRSIPPRTTMRDRHAARGDSSHRGGSGGLAAPISSGGGYKGGTYTSSYKKTFDKSRTRAFVKKKGLSIKVDELKDIQLDILEEDGNELRIIGEFPGLTEDDLIIQFEDGKLLIMTKPNTDRRYEVSVELPKVFTVAVKEKKVRNGIMTLILEKVEFEEVTELDKVFQKCMKKFPELENKRIQLKVMRCRRNGGQERLEGAKGKVNGKEAVMLWVPDKVWGFWDALRPIIYHELSHFISLEDPDKVFFDRADKKSIKLWKMLQEINAAECSVEKN